MARYTKVLKSLAHNAVGDRRIQAAAPAGTNFYTTGATLGGNNILTGSTQTTTWTADLSALAGGGGTIGGSITDNQIAVGASTANSIEGSAQFKYDGSKILLGDSSDTGNYLLVEGSDSDNTYNILEGKRKYPRIRLTDTFSSNKTQDIWLLNTQLRIGSNGGTAGNAAMVIQSGNAGDVFFNGNVGIGTSGPQQPLHVLTSANDKGILIDVSDDTHEGRLLFGDTSSNAIGYVGYNHSLDAMRFFTNGSESLRLESDQDAVFYGNIIATGATAHVIVGQYTRLQRNINTNGLHLTDSGGNAVAYTTLSGATGGFWLDNTTSNRIYRGAGVSYWDSTESYRLQGNTTSGYMQLDMNKIMLVRSASSAASNVLQIGDGSTYDQFSIVEDQRGSSATNGYVKLRAKKTGNDGYRKISLGAISGSTTSELLIDSISTTEALRFDTNSKSHAFDIAKAGYVSVGGAVDNTNQFTVLGTSLLSGNTVVEGNITGSSNVLLGSNLVHYGDTDTYIGFTGDDIEIFAGGESFIKMTEATTDSSLVFNDGSEDIDIRMESDANDSMFFLDSGLSRIGIGTPTPSQLLHVAGNGLFTGGLTVGDSAADTFVTRGHTHLATMGNSVGIGTTSPDSAAKITILGKIYANIGSNSNLAFGSGSFAHTSGISNYSGFYSTGLGIDTLKTISGAAHRNTAVGYRAMFGDSTGIEGTDNTGIGAYALQNIKDGTYNVAVGGGAGLSITDGTSNTFIGLNAGKFNTTTNYNVAIGSETMQLVGADSSTAIGYFSMNEHSGDTNVALGAYSLRRGTGAYNVGLGVSAMTNVSGGVGGVAVGYQSGYHPTGNYNTWVGYNAGFGTAAGGGYNNVGVGKEALMNISSGYQHVAIGTAAGKSVTTALRNVIIGAQAVESSNTDESVIIGAYAGFGTTTAIDSSVIIGTYAAQNGSPSNAVILGRQAGYYASGAGNIYMGYQSGFGNATTNNGTYNTAIGYEAMELVQDADENVAIGSQALRANTSGDGNTAVGTNALYVSTTANHNVAVGHRAMFTSTTAAQNVAVGKGALYDLTEGDDNVAVGKSAGGDLTSGHKNIAIGTDSMRLATTAHSSVAIGYQALDSTTLGSENVAVGAYAGQALVGTTSSVYGGFCTFIGHTAGYGITGNVSYGGNTMVGHAAGYAATGADRSTGLGASALYYADGAKYNTAVGRVAGAYAKGTGSTHVGDSSGYRVSGNYNVSIGYGALSGASSGTGYGTAAQNVAIGRDAMTNVTSAEQSVVIGYDAGKAITTANKTVAIGYQAGESITTGGDNVLIGHQAGKNTTGQYNVMLGKGAGSANTDPNGNTFIGNNAAALNTTGYHSVVVGFQAAYSNQTSHKNTIVGYNAGQNFTDGQNTMLGYEAGYNSTTATQNTFIGTNAGRNNTTGDGNVIVGNAAGPSSTSTDSNKLYIHNAAGTPLIGGDFANGRVGINVETPDKSFVIRTGGSRDFKFYDYDMTYESSLGIRAKNGGYLGLVTEGANDVFISTNGFANKRLVVKSDGDVGIGTTSPDRKLDVQSTSTAVVVSGTGGGTYGVMRVVDTADTTALEVVGQRSDGEGALMRLKHESTSPDVGDYVGTISFEGNDDGGARSPYAYIRGRIRDKSAGAEDGSLYFQVVENNARTDVMTLSGTKVGIGTTSPAELFNVESASNTLALFKSTDNRGLIQVADDDTTASIVAENSTLSLGLTSQISASNINIDSSGKLGIGTTSPSYPLHVAQGTATYGIYMPNSNSRGIRFGDTSNNGTGYGRIEGIGGSLFLGSTQVYTSIIGTGDASTTLGSQNRRWSYFFTRFGQVGYDTSTTTTAQFGISGASDKVPLEVYAYNKTTPAIHVTSGNRVGINTTSPAHGLTVFNTDFYLNSGDMHISQNKYFKNANDGGQSHGFPSSGKYVFNNVNVGIGTSAPTAKLHVDGDIRIDSGHTLDFQTKAYIDVNLLDGTGDDKLILRRRGNTNEVVFDMSTASAPIIDSPNGTLDFQAASTPVAQFKDDTGIIMQDMQGIKNHVATLANFPIDAGTGIATADIQGFSKIQNISLAAYAGGGLPTNLDIKLPVGAAGMEFIVTLGDTALNLGSLTLRLVANGSDIIYNAANAVSNISYTKNVGESIHLICFEANKWSVVAHT